MALTSNIKNFIGFYSNVKKQMLFAGGNALNDSSISVNKAIEAQLKSTYDITTSWYKAGNKYGSRKTKPIKTETDVSQIVGIRRGGTAKELTNKDTKEHWIEKHETGGIKKPYGNSSSIFIPTKIYLEKYGTAKGKSGRRKAKKILDKSNEENNILSSRGVFTYKRKIKGNTYLMARPNKKVDGKRFSRTKTGRKSTKKQKVFQKALPMFLIVKQVHIDDTLDYSKTAKKIYQSTLEKNFHNRFTQAMNTARIKIV